MKKAERFLKKVAYAVFFSCLLLSNAKAAGPLWAFVAQTPTSISITKGEVAQVIYTVYNQSSKNKNLIMKPITGINQSTPCLLTPKGSCVLKLNISGSDLQGDVSGGPALCEQGNALQCYQPSLDYALKIHLLKQPSVRQYSINASAGAGGTITPSGTFLVDAGTALSFTAHPNPGFQVKQWLLDNTLVQTGGVSYQLNNIQANHQVTVSFQAIPATPLIAAGSYFDVGATVYPMLAQSTDHGASWAYAIEKASTLPTDFTSYGSFYGTGCGGGTCLAGGQYTDGSTTYPMLVQNTDGGTSWIYVIEKAVLLPPGFGSFGQFTDASCAGSTCIASGFYLDVGFITYPMLAQNSNGGLNWAYAVDKNTLLPADFSDNGRFSNANCEGSICIASGTYSDGSTQYPMLLQSTNSGTSWAYAIEKSVSLPAGFSNNGDFNSSSCAGSLCIAGGTYSDANFGGTFYPMLAQSTNGGALWGYPIEKAVNLPSGFNGGGYFSSVSCAASICIAGGSYSSLGTSYPMLALTTDGGTTWSYVIDKSVGLPAGFLLDGIVNSVSCSDSICIASGAYHDGGLAYPMLIQSTDGGTTWTYTVDRNTLLPQGLDDSSSFSSASCSGSTCLAGGQYLSGAITYPMLLQSTDDGATWSYQIEKAVNLPLDYQDSGTFFGTSAISSFLPDSLRFLASQTGVSPGIFKFNGE